IILTLKVQAATARFQFFASLEKWIGARNPVRIGSSCAAVTGYDFPLGQSPKISGVKAGRRCGVAQASLSQEPEYLSGPPHSAVAVIADPGCNRKNFFAKRRM